MKVVFIGCGNITNLRHIPAVKKIIGKHSNEVGLVALRVEDAEKAASNFKNPRIYIGNILESGTPEWIKEAELIIIGTPPGTHIEIILRLLEISPNSKILCEKPLGHELLQISNFMSSELLKANRKRVFMMHNFQFSDGFKQAQKILRGGSIGKVTNFHAHQYSSNLRGLPDWYESLPLGLFWDECSHFFYLAKSFCGDFEINAVNHFMDVGRNTPNQLDISAFSSRKIPVSFRMNFNAPISEWGCSIICERGVIFVDMFRDMTIVIESDGAHKALQILKSSASFVVQYILGFIISGWKHVLGKKFYGTDEVLKILINNDQEKIDLINIDEGYWVINRMFEVSDQIVLSQEEEPT